MLYIISKGNWLVYILNVFIYFEVANIQNIHILTTKDWNSARE